MVIRKGIDWGSPGALPTGAPIADSNQTLRALLRDGVRVMGITGGDLCRTLGGPGQLDMTFPVDLCHVSFDGVEDVFASHLVARRGWWRGPVVAAMNAQFIGSWDVAPRSHPNDGIVDTFEATLSVADRIKARRRLPAGTHVPHPRIVQRRLAAGELDFGAVLHVWIDGATMGRHGSVHLTVEPDALTVVL